VKLVKDNNRRESVGHNWLVLFCKETKKELPVSLSIRYCTTGFPIVTSGPYECYRWNDLNASLGARTILFCLCRANDSKGRINDTRGAHRVTIRVVFDVSLAASLLHIRRAGSGV
jgi:hypothetical protein